MVPDQPGTAMQIAIATTDAALERTVPRKVFWRIIPFCFALYIISYIDRANIGYAALQMNAELALSSQAFGFAAGIFFLGYFLFEVPSNVALLRFGPRKWIARILLSWGVVSILTAFVQSAPQLYVLRFLLGVAEAGFFPGIILYLTLWFRAKEQATVIAMFTAAIPVSYVLGGPLSTLIMEHVSGFGLSGWRWMLLLEGIPAILGGIITYWLLTDRVDQATWLSEPERTWLAAQMAKDHAPAAGRRTLGTFAAITHPRVLYLSIIYFVYQCGSLGVGYWLPQIVKGLSTEASTFEIGMISTTPYIVATIGMVLWSRSSDKRQERYLHTALPLLAASLTLGAVGLATNMVVAVGLVTVALTGLYAFKAPFWALPGMFLSRGSAAIAIAAINSIGNLGGFVGPWVIGTIKDATGSAVPGLIFLAVLIFVAFMMVWLEWLRKDQGAQDA
jgi:ACS family tartrate transporter-like MFS transporter